MYRVYLNMFYKMKVYGKVRKNCPETRKCSAEGHTVKWL